MPIIIALMARIGVPEPLRRLAAYYITLAVGVVALCGAGYGAYRLWLHFHDNRVIEAHDAKQAAKVTATELSAEQTAEANDQIRQVDRQSKAAEVSSARDEAIRSNPDEASKPAGPATRAVLDRLRAQQKH